MARKNNSVSDKKLQGASGGKVQKNARTRKYDILDNDNNQLITSYDNALDAEKGDLLYHQGKKVGKLDGFEQGFSEGIDKVMKALRHGKK